VKLNSCTTIELKDERLRCLRRLCGLADKMAKIDAILAVHKSNETKLELAQPNLRYIMATC